MAQRALPKPSFWLNRKSFIAVTMTAITAVYGTANAQTVVIGGSGTAPVEINMRALAPATPYIAPQARLSGQPGNQDFSKSSRIVFGNEVITLIPPGSKPKKKKKAVARVKAAPVKKVDMAKITPPKKAIEKLAPAKTVEEITEQPKSKKTPEMKVVKTEPAKSPKETAPKKESASPAVVKKPAPETKTVIAAKPKDIEKPKDVEKKAVASAPSPTVEKSKPKEVAATPNTNKPKPIVKAVTPETPEKKETTEPEQEMQVASIAPDTANNPVEKKPAETTLSASGENQIFFEPEETKLPANANKRLESISSTLKSGNDRVQLVAYADANSNSAARRLSLGRALVVRSKLMELGVPNNKIEVRALGKPTDGSPADRVDLKLITR